MADFDLAETASGILKIRFLVTRLGAICPLKIGQRNLQVAGLQLKIIFDGFRQIGSASPGILKEETVNCSAHLYIEIADGKLSRIVSKKLQLNKG